MPKVGLSDPEDKARAVKQGSNRVTTRVYVVVARLSRVFTAIAMSLSPTLTGTVFPVIGLPLAVMVTLCLVLLAVEVNLICLISLATVAEYRVISPLKLGSSVPVDKDNPVKAGLRRVTLRVYVVVALLSCVLTAMVMVLSPTFKGTESPVIDLPLAVMIILCLALLAVGVNLICSISLATVVIYRVDASPH